LSSLQRHFAQHGPCRGGWASEAMASPSCKERRLSLNGTTCRRLARDNTSGLCPPVACCPSQRVRRSSAVGMVRSSGVKGNCTWVTAIKAHQDRGEGLFLSLSLSLCGPCLRFKRARSAKHALCTRLAPPGGAHAPLPAHFLVGGTRNTRRDCNRRICVFRNQRPAAAVLRGAHGGAQAAGLLAHLIAWKLL